MLNKDLDDFISLPTHVLQAVRNNAGMLWALLNTDLELVWLSPNLETQLPKKEAHSTRYWDTLIITGDMAAATAFEALILKAQKSQQSITTSCLQITLSTSQKLTDLTILPFKEDKKEWVLLGLSLANGDFVSSDQEALTYEDTNEKLFVTLKSLAEGVITTDAQGLVELINPTGENITGWDLKSARGKSLSEVFPLQSEKYKKPLPNPFDEVLSTGLPVGINHSVALINRQGDPRTIAFDMAPILNKSGKTIGSVLVFNDITQKLHTERELQKIQKMESLAMLSAGIAHDFNNFLTSIVGNLSLARHNISPDHKLYTILKAAERSTERARYLTDRLFSFSKNSPSPRRETSLFHLLHDSVNFVLSGSHCQHETDIADDLWAAVVDEGQISQVLNNLLINATQAMPEGGVVRTNARNRTMQWDPSLNLENGPYIEIEISDNGCGIAAEHMDKLFEPYFTTKPDGNGIGLATTYSIVKGHTGHIHVDSTLDVGTVFTLYLPAEPNIRIFSEETNEQRIYHGEGYILVIDDEEIIQQILDDMLTHLGYEVDFAFNGEEATEKVKNAIGSKKPYDAVILDLSVNKGSGGTQALHLIRQHAPEIKTIISSGYIHSPEVENYTDYGFSGAVIKPYNIEQLSWTIKSVLES